MNSKAWDAARAGGPVGWGIFPLNKRSREVGDEETIFILRL
jgi:hypothetical protein